MFAALESVVPPLATLEITLPPALIPAVLSIDKPPTVTLSVVIPVPVIAVVPFVKPDVLITVLPAVTESTVIFLAVNVTSLPDAAVEINLLSPLILKDTLPSFKDLAVVDAPLSSANAIVWAMFAVFVAIFVVLVVI